MGGRIVVDVVAVRNVFMTPCCDNIGFKLVWYTGIGTSARWPWEKPNGTIAPDRYPDFEMSKIAGEVRVCCKPFCTFSKSIDSSFDLDCGRRDVRTRQVMRNANLLCR